MNLGERFFYGVKRFVRPLRLSRFGTFRKINRLAWISLRLEDEYLTITASIVAGLLRQGQVGVDVGANRGIVARAMLKAVGDSGAVHAFEPNARLAAHLQRIDGLKVHAIALGRIRKHLKLFVPSKNDTISSLSYEAVVSSATNEELRHVRTEEVEVHTLDSLKLEPVHLIKVDAQGAELDVLLGAEKTIRRWRPIIVVEVWPEGLRQFGANDNSVTEFLRKMRYATARFGGGATWWDILAIPLPKPSRARARCKSS